MEVWVSVKLVSMSFLIICTVKLFRGKVTNPMSQTRKDKEKTRIVRPAKKPYQRYTVCGNGMQGTKRSPTSFRHSRPSIQNNWIKTPRTLCLKSPKARHFRSRHTFFFISSFIHPDIKHGFLIEC